MSGDFDLPVARPTLVDILHWRASTQPDRRAYTFLADGEREDSSLSYRDLDRWASAVAGGLSGLAIAGDRALLLFPSGLDFLAAFFGCLYAGVIAVPAPPPYPTQLRRALPRLQAIVRDAQPAVVLTTGAILSMLEPSFAQAPELAELRWETIDGPREPAPAAPPAVARHSQDDLAFLQYTSGSTAVPKGVMVSHGNLMHHAAYIGRVWNYGPDSVSVTWMPNFHDYGLIEGLIHPLYRGIPSYLMTPRAFVQQPIRWLRAIARYRATNSAGPNFAYDHCVEKITPDQCDGLDLSGWAVAGNGAEPVRRDTLERFARAFAPYGFRWEAFFPSYGLAEATLVVSAGGAAARGPVLLALDRDALEQRGRVAAAADGAPAQTLVGCGQVAEGAEAVIAQPDSGRRCAPDEVGEIWVAGPSVAQGYWQRPEETAATFGARLDDGAGPFLRTGDLGFFHRGELFIAGRLKDLIIVDGNNYYPQDIELTVEGSHPAVRRNGCAAFAIDSGGAERLVVVAEVDRHYRPGPGDSPAMPGDVAITLAIRRAIAQQHELQAQDICLIPAGSILKTSSGKIQRQACRAAYLSNEFTRWAPRG